MESYLQGLHPYEGALTLVLTAVLAVTSVGMMIANVYLARESSLQRKAGTEPDVVGYLLPDERASDVMWFHLKNVGRGTAVRVGFEVLGDVAELHSMGVLLPLDSNRPPISVLPQDEGIRLLLGVAHELVKAPRPIVVRLTYENVKNGRTVKDVVLDVKQFEGFCPTIKRAEDDMADALKKIVRHLEQLGKGSHRLQVVAASPDDWQEQDDLDRQRREEQVQKWRAAQGKAAD